MRRLSEEAPAPMIAYALVLAAGVTVVALQCALIYGHADDRHFHLAIFRCHGRDDT